MSVLIDDLVKNADLEEVGGTWYVAKPLNKVSIWQRIKDCTQVLHGNARVFHYFEDEASTWGEVIDGKR